MVWRLGLFLFKSFCLLLSALSKHLCVFFLGFVLLCGSAPWSGLSISACICFWWLGSECGDASASRWSYNLQVDSEMLSV